MRYYYYSTRAGACYFLTLFIRYGITVLILLKWRQFDKEEERERERGNKTATPRMN